ncbi:hypothetical protein O181_011947 [Austropuccinia psidii MF-1]|uniref:Reverse transcriptase Ty1/copia-type domain-containing protein n=1 Tax=Austropuccinia psidii MF-1 TaxID=1389203 RepID=A0A9Q3BWP9_9BASI|nr:hypothetical protein [Austropuccinia psidii MF-1]
MVKELNGQDKSIELFSATASLRSDSPRNFVKAMKDENRNAWKAAMDTELASLEMMKAWVVVQGYCQIQGPNFDKNFAPMPKFASLRSLFAIASENGWEVQTFNMTTAYLHSSIKEDIFVKPPPGLFIPSGTVLQLNKASREMLVASSQGNIRQTGFPSNRFESSQPALIRKLFSLNPSKITAEQPLPIMDLSSEKATRIDKEYLSQIGMLLYIAQATRPDIMFLVNLLARFSMNTTPKHWAALDHLIPYMRGSTDRALVIQLEGWDKSL